MIYASPRPREANVHGRKGQKETRSIGWVGGMVFVASIWARSSCV